MEKLVKLLNEYHFSGTEYVGYYLDEKENRIYFRTKVVDKGLVDEQRISDERIISKKFGFIKRLVDNDKIDFNFVERVGSGDFIYDMDSPYYYSCTCEDLKEYNEVDRVLMLLAIQDEPVKFLVSILK